MPRNVGGLDRIGRIVLGLGLIALAASGTVGAWGWLGLLPLATAALGRCPPDTRLGINACRTLGPRGAGP
ncbi:DUF2892 domain-containing protein [Limnohabitans sp.]|jgi:hypothetical protein|uniref:YgaP family membrane protein n=1 Tax=Limnohabitans sp. TaxID=1907725 RepID=UPI0039190D75